jgi:uncharacterized protein (DUF486 family)
MPRWLVTVLLLVGSNTFMTVAWYAHLRWASAHGPDGQAPSALTRLLPVIAISWLIALPEYILQVPANRLGHVNFAGPFTAAQLKVIQEAVTLVVFTAFALLYLREKLRINDVIAFALIFVAVAVSMYGRGAPPATDQARSNTSASTP